MAVRRAERPPRPGEELVYHRFVIACDTYQMPSPTMNLMAVTCGVQWLTNMRLARSFLAVADPDTWHAMFAYLNFRRIPEAAFDVGGKPFTVYTHDWRA